MRRNFLCGLCLLSLSSWAGPIANVPVLQKTMRDAKGQTFQSSCSVGPHGVTVTHKVGSHLITETRESNFPKEVTAWIQATAKAKIVKVPSPDKLSRTDYTAQIAGVTKQFVFLSEGPEGEKRDASEVKKLQDLIERECGKWFVEIGS